MLLTAPGVVWRDLREQIAMGSLFVLAMGTVYMGLTLNKPLGRVIPFAASMFFVFFGGLRHYMIRRRLKRVTLLITPWPVRLGEEIELKFRATLRSASPISDFKAQLECAEEVTVGSGKSQQKKRSTLFALDLSSSGAQREDGKVTGEWKVGVPAELPPSLDVQHNAVRWLVNAGITTGGIEVPAKVEFVVIPELAS